MMDLPVHDHQGKVIETIQFDESCLGKCVNYTLMHQAIVMYEANQRQGTHAAKNRRALVGTRSKAYRQKGTGRARMGFKHRTGSRGGAATHGPRPRDYGQQMPKKARRQALRSALLGKLRDGEIVIVNELTQSQPRTKDIVETLKNLKIQKSCLVVTKAPDTNIWKSVRNIPSAAMLPLAELHPYGVLKPEKVLMTKEALQALAEEKAK